MDYDYICIEEEKAIRSHLEEILEAKVIEKIMNRAKLEDEENIRAGLEGDGYRITKALTPKLYDICHSVLESLQFEEPTLFYVVNIPTVNAASIRNPSGDGYNFIVLHSETVERFDDDELRFVIGHEIGHLISGFTKLSKIINFIWEEDKIPLIFSNKIILWRQIAELSADRFGFIASPSLEKCISNFFKASSGLSEKMVDFNPWEYLKQISSIIDMMKKDKTRMVSSHPVNPIRIKALEYFSKSNLFKSIREGKEISEDEELNNNTKELIELMKVMKGTNLGQSRLIVVAIGGLLAAMSDREINERELEGIILVLSRYEMFPKVLLERYSKDLCSDREKAIELFADAVQKIIKERPLERFQILEYMIDVILMDRKIREEEVEFVFNIGEKLLLIPEKEIAQILAGKIRETFVPSVL